MKKNILSVIIVIAVVVGSASISWIKEHGWNRPYFEWGISELAEYLVQNNRSPKGCFDLIWHGIGQQAGEAQAECIYKYASLAKDPSACELLMPSSYGLSCVGGAESESDHCSMGNGKVSWNNGEETYASCANTTKKRSQDADACCLIARVTFVLSENDCSPIKQYPDMYDECLQNLAFKNHDPATCNDIENDNTKSACIVNASAIRRDPSICSGCKNRVQTLSELK